MYKIKAGAIVFILLIMATVGIFFNNPVAHAGSNGQEIRFTNSSVNTGNQSCPSGRLQNVQISGTNQRGVGSVWKGYSANGSDVYASNWWWSGNVVIDYTVNGRWYELVTNIPTQAREGQYDYNYAYVNCLGNRVYLQYQWSWENYAWWCVNLRDNPTGHYVDTRYIKGFTYFLKDGALANPSLYSDIYYRKGYMVYLVQVTFDQTYPTCG